MKNVTIFKGEVENLECELFGSEHYIKNHGSRTLFKIGANDYIKFAGDNRAYVDEEDQARYQCDRGRYTSTYKVGENYRLNPGDLKLWIDGKMLPLSCGDVILLTNGNASCQEYIEVIRPVYNFKDLKRSNGRSSRYYKALESACRDLAWYWDRQQEVADTRTYNDAYGDDEAQVLERVEKYCRKIYGQYNHEKVRRIVWQYTEY